MHFCMALWLGQGHSGTMAETMKDEVMRAEALKAEALKAEALEAVVKAVELIGDVRQNS